MAWERYAAVDLWSSMGRASLDAIRPNSRATSSLMSLRSGDDFIKNFSASVALRMVGPTEPIASRGELSTIAKHAEATEMTIALRTPTFEYP